MEILWAPWRVKYIKKIKNKTCFLCEAIKEKTKRKKFVLIKTKKAISILNIYPYNNGHTLVAPCRHIGSLEKLTSQEIEEIFSQINKVISALKKAFKPSGFNLGLNIGKPAGAGLTSHLHIHIVPRWQGDTNFMPLLNSTKVMPQALEETYKEIKKNLCNE